MQTIPNPLSGLSRPRLLVGAVRIGLSRYRRDASLRRLLKGMVPPPGHATIAHLAQVEADLDHARICGTGPYSVAQHVEALTALVAETRAILDAPAADGACSGAGAGSIARPCPPSRTTPPPSLTLVPTTSDC